MDKNIKIFRALNSVIIVENGCKKIINDRSLMLKNNEDILKIYNRKGGKSE